MLHRRRRLAARFLAVGLLAATLSAVDSLAFPDTAEARCAGNGNPVVSSFSYGGTVRVSEDPETGTCNGTQLYTAVLEDRSADGNCVLVRFWEASIGWRVGAATCGPDMRFEYRDDNNNSRAYEQFCIWDDDPPFIACGWGTQVGEQYYGVNYGY
jgi:hypothetical protein